MDTRIHYFIVGIRPVYLERRSDGMVLKSFKFNWDNGEFMRDDEGYASRIIFGRIDEIDEVSEKEFRDKVHELRKQKGFI